eukprot:7382124-Prymnesium_polylepis.1
MRPLTHTTSLDHEAEPTMPRGRTRCAKRGRAYGAPLSHILSSTLRRPSETEPTVPRWPVNACVRGRDRAYGAPPPWPKYEAALRA